MISIPTDWLAIGAAVGTLTGWLLVGLIVAGWQIVAFWRDTGALRTTKPLGWTLGIVLLLGLCLAGWPLVIVIEACAGFWKWARKP